MIRRTHSIRVRLRMPVDTSSRMSSGRPMIFTNDPGHLEVQAVGGLELGSG